MSEMLEKLESPPIVEVVAGVTFAALQGLDVLAAGVFWAAIKDKFPRRGLREPIIEITPGATAQIDPAQMRAMFIGADETTILQLQHDRFYVNWKRAQTDTVEGARAGEYPRFSDAHAPGLITRVEEHFGAFSEFCQRELGARPAASEIDLAKVDVFIEGIDWSGLDDAYSMLPWLGSLSRLVRSHDPAFLFRFEEQRQDTRVVVSLSRTSLRESDGDARRRAIKLETRARRTMTGESMRDAFLRANAVVNEAFAELVPKSERVARFQGIER
jgi:uncharacterized protein (TIGR04255 family)